jgi:REP element-mobilizing transposase RayT
MVMPNHVHGIIVINPREDDAHTDMPNQRRDDAGIVSTNMAKRSTLSTVIGSYKSAASKWAHTNGHLSFRWQLRFHDRIVRDDEEANRIREYIQSNPATWKVEKNKNEGFIAFE